MLLYPGEIVLIDIKTHRTTGIAIPAINEAALCGCGASRLIAA
jgi:CDGSH-type Zn-finger protein